MQCHKVAHHPLCCQIYFMDNFIFTVVNARNWLGRNEGGTEATFTPTRPVQDGELEEISILIWPGSFLDDDRDSEYSSQPVPLRSSMQPHLPPKNPWYPCARSSSILRVRMIAITAAEALKVVTWHRETLQKGPVVPQLYTVPAATPN